MLCVKVRELVRDWALSWAKTSCRCTRVPHVC